jgi:hypothetical protein
MTNRIWQMFDRIDTDELEKLIAGGNYLETWKFVERNILGLN